MPHRTQNIFYITPLYHAQFNLRMFSANRAVNFFFPCICSFRTFPYRVPKMLSNVENSNAKLFEFIGFGEREDDLELYVEFNDVAGYAVEANFAKFYALTYLS